MVYVGGKLKKSFHCLKPLIGNYKPGSAVSTAVFVYIFACGLLCSNVYAFTYTGIDDWFIISYVCMAVVVMGLC